MITFYPRDISMWRTEYDFHPDITLAPKTKTFYKCFHNKEVFIEYLKEHGIRLDDPANPLMFTDVGEEIPERIGCQSVIQFSCVGWIKNDFR